MRALRFASLSAYRHLFGWRATTRLAEGWRVLAQHPEVIRDLCALGHIFEIDTSPTGEALPHDELVARAARKSMALLLLARAEVTHEELNLIRKEPRYEEPDADE